MSKVRTITNAGTSSTGTFPSTSTGNQKNGLDMYQVVGTVACTFEVPGVKAVTWRMQGNLGSGNLAWTNLNAAASTSTGTGQVLSTVAGLWNHIRILSTANLTTGNRTATWVVAGKP